MQNIEYHKLVSRQKHVFYAFVQARACPKNFTTTIFDLEQHDQVLSN